MRLVFTVIRWIAPAHLGEEPNMAAQKIQPIVTIQDRLENGNLTIDEVCALANRSKTGFYSDLKAGLVTIRKVGRKSIVPGPIAKAYIAGETIAA
jgi:hypothetical protein